MAPKNTGICALCHGEFSKAAMTRHLATCLHDENMEIQVGRVLRPGVRFGYQYDFGSTTALALRVVGQRASNTKDRLGRHRSGNDWPCSSTWFTACQETAARRGGPADDLAIVTRGSRRPFHVEGGWQRLLDAYNARGPSARRPVDVHRYELCLAAGFYEQDARAYGVGSPHADNTRATFRNLLRRVGGFSL